MRSEPQHARTLVWALSISLAATLEITVVFFSSGYLDVSVHRVPLHTLWIGVWIHEGFSCGFPHSDIHGSGLICSSPWLFAACRVLLRLPVPRHSPCALSSLNFMSFANLLFRSKCHLQTPFRVFVHCARCSFFTLTNSQPFLFSCLSLRILFNA